MQFIEYFYKSLSDCAAKLNDDWKIRQWFIELLFAISQLLNTKLNHQVPTSEQALTECVDKLLFRFDEHIRPDRFQTLVTSFTKLHFKQAAHHKCKFL